MKGMELSLILRYARNCALFYDFPAPGQSCLKAESSETDEFQNKKEVSEICPDLFSGIVTFSASVASPPSRAFFAISTHSPPLKILSEKGC